MWKYHGEPTGWVHYCPSITPHIVRWSWNAKRAGRLNFLPGFRLSHISINRRTAIKLASRSYGWVRWRCARGSANAKAPRFFAGKPTPTNDDDVGVGINESAFRCKQSLRVQLIAWNICKYATTAAPLTALNCTTDTALAARARAWWRGGLTALLHTHHLYCCCCWVVCEPLGAGWRRKGWRRRRRQRRRSMGWVTHRVQQILGSSTCQWSANCCSCNTHLGTYSSFGSVLDSKCSYSLTLVRWWGQCDPDKDAERALRHRGMKILTS